MKTELEIYREIYQLFKEYQKIWGDSDEKAALKTMGDLMDRYLCELERSNRDLKAANEKVKSYG